MKDNGLDIFRYTPPYGPEDMQREIDILRAALAKSTAERDEARQEVCFLLSRNVTQSCDGDTPEFHATARGWCYLLEEDDE